ncbi:hypothetical protein DSM104329_02119 [Capillimicrobium parvum]|uniref:Aminoglycoside phosphotransferase domain-containing protein n=1 Tax=Capillimicrobium parvum TaxID=2884022 RepID=A0A9E6XWH0_9ACTN|nr:hypothetical protein DSM104329_02119 [Capillimicrobium parvum]
MTDAQLRAHLADRLGSPVAGLRRAPLPRRSSFAVEVLDVELAGGGRRRMLLKDVASAALASEAAAAKPAFVLDPRRELIVYRDVVGPMEVGVPRLLGGVADPARQSFWLLLELVDGEPLAEMAAGPAWAAAARWLADLHVRAVGAPPAELLRYDASWFRGWLARARALAPPGSLDRVARGHERVLRRLLAWPSAFVHGEFYASNVLVERGTPPRLRVVDWEMAGIGPGLLDLAALTAGAWSGAQRERLALEYHETWSAAGGRASADQLLETLECARLVAALQWIGWSSTWSPPAEHAQDWVAEARRAAERLEL